MNAPKKPKILIADDDYTNLILMEQIIKRTCNAEIKKASDGMAALNLIRDIKPEIIFSDNKMPKLTGIELFKRLKNEMKDYNFDFILVSGSYFNEKTIRQLKKEGLREFLEKPFKLSDVRNLLRKCVSDTF